MSGRQQPSAPDVVTQEYDPAVPLAALKPHPANPNVGDLDLLDELLSANGFAGAVMAQKSSGTLIDGEHRWRKMRERGAATIPVLWVDVDDGGRDRLLASINESGRRGKNDEARLIALLKLFARPGSSMAGTAFSADQLAALVRHHSSVTASPDDPDSEWQNMPEFQQPSKWGEYATHIHFATMADAEAFFKLIGRDRTRVVWWPQPDGHTGDLLSHRVVAGDPS
jgi:hypothetical protein